MKPILKYKKIAIGIPMFPINAVKVLSASIVVYENQCKLYLKLHQTASSRMHLDGVT